MAQVADVGQLNFNTFTQGAQNFVQNIQNAAQQGVALVNDPLAAAVKSITFSTNFSPETTYTGRELSDIYRDPTPNPYLKFIKPSIIIETPLGRRVIAPYGKPDPSMWKANVAQVVLMTASVSLLVGIGIFVWGRHVGRKGG